MQTREALICEPLRTAVGRFGGVYKDLSVQHLGADDFRRLNVNGSGISLGHPVGATGGRILAAVFERAA